MDTLDCIFSRHSVRKFKDKDVPESDIHTILQAAMSGPSAVNCRPWQFLVTKRKDVLERMAKANGPYATPLTHAAFGVMVAGDLSKAYSNAPEYWQTDCSIAAQNMILAAQALGVGSVWLGTFPEQERVQALKEEFNLPENIVPHSLIAFGYPVDNDNHQRDLFESEKVHVDKW